MITATSAEFLVAGGLLCLKRRGRGHRWEISLYERVLNGHTALMEGMLRLQELSPSQYIGRTFAEPVQAAKFIRRLVATEPSRKAKKR